MAVAAASARGADGRPWFRVVGVDLPTEAGQRRVNALARGRFPFETTDPDLERAARRGYEEGNLSATSDPSVYETAEIVVVDVHLDVDFSSDPPTAKLDGFRSAITTLGGRLPPGALVIVETTVPPGTTEKIVAPILRERLTERGLDPESIMVAHCYERVMPGRDYLSSITNFWRVYSGLTPEAADACQAFLDKVVNTLEFPPTRLGRPVESETAKLMENSFRATNIAFIEEWARFSERAGINLGAVVDAIRVRPTHRNLMRPGFGVGGYCLTKDPLLVGVGAREILGLDDVAFPFCEAAVATNRQMPRATLNLIERSMGRLDGLRILLLGASYREDVADTRYSPSADFVVWAEAKGASVAVHDPLVEFMEELDRPVSRSLPRPDDFDVVVFAVAHQAYRTLEPDVWRDGPRPLIVDANMVLDARQITALRDLGFPVKSVGRGDL